MDTTINATVQNNVQNDVQTAVQPTVQPTQNAATVQPTAQPTQKKVTAKVTAVYFEKYDDNQYFTISLRLNKPLKLMKQNDAGIYEETTTVFLSKPAAALLQDVNDDIAAYYLSMQGATQQSLSTALSGAELTIRQKLLVAGETDGDVTNESDHDQWFSFIDKLTVSKMAKLVMSKQLGLSIDELKLLLED